VLRLRAATDESWAARAVGNLEGVLVDHAHCELKAASNALSMAARHADDPAVVRVLTSLAHEEIEHFQAVNAHLEARGIRLGNPPTDPYVAALRRAHLTVGPSPVAGVVAGAVDRLLICALIEARSCERFALLAKALVPVDAALSAFYADLRAAEARHYRTFIDLAVHTSAGNEAAVFQRLEALSTAEGQIVLGRAGQAVDATIHG